MPPTKKQCILSFRIKQTDNRKLSTDNLYLILTTNLIGKLDNWLIGKLINRSIGE